MLNVSKSFSHSLARPRLCGRGMKWLPSNARIGDNLISPMILGSQWDQGLPEVPGVSLGWASLGILHVQLNLIHGHSNDCSFISFDF